MTTLGWIIAAAAVPLVYVAAELTARWWIRRRDQYRCLPPGLRLRLHIDSEVFPQLERETRIDVNRDGERGDEVPRSSEWTVSSARRRWESAGRVSSRPGHRMARRTPAHARTAGATPQARRIESPCRQHRPLRRRIRGARPDLRSRAASLSAPAARSSFSSAPPTCCGGWKTGRRVAPAFAAHGGRFQMPSRGAVRLEAQAARRDRAAAEGPAALAPADPACTSAPAAGLARRARCARARR